jgi:hypothetical protein
MNIPIDFIKNINPNLIDPISKSTVYTFIPGSHQCTDNRELLFRFPYSENTYWTHFKYATSLPNTVLESELLVITEYDQECVILPLDKRQPSTWHDTIWPLPSINTSGGAGIYLKIKPPTDKFLWNLSILPQGVRTDNLDIVVHLSGFVDLLPIVEQYVIMPGVNTPLIQLAISRGNNTIYRLEDYDPNMPNTLLVQPLLPNYK